MQRKTHAVILFSKVAKEEIFREILNLDVSKACQGTDVLSKIIKGERRHLCLFFTLFLIRLLLTRNFHQF